jgi:hypothetical protein
MFIVGRTGANANAASAVGALACSRTSGGCYSATSRKGEMAQTRWVPDTSSLKAAVKVAEGTLTVIDATAVVAKVVVRLFEPNEATQQVTIESITAIKSWPEALPTMKGMKEPSIAFTTKDPISQGASSIIPWVSYLYDAG